MIHETVYRPVPDFTDLYAGMDGSIILAGVGELEQKIRDRYLSVRIPSRGIRNVHILVAEAFLGPKPQGLHTRHGEGGRLDNTPGNLCYGTSSDNQKDSVRAGTHRNTAKTSCSQGHKYTPENTYVSPNGGRQCRKCRYISNQNGVAPKVRGRHVSTEEIEQIKSLSSTALSNRAIANMIGVSPQTVARHRTGEVK